MASPNSVFTDIVTTTLEGYSGEIADNITNHNAFARQIDRKGNKQVATGRDIIQEIEWSVNSTVSFYSGAEIFDVSPSEVLTAAQFNYKQMVGSVVLTGLEDIQNSGKEAIHSLLKARMRNLEKSLRNQYATSIYGDGTGTNGKEIGGLQLLIADVPTNSVGGISGSSFSFWKNQVYSFSGDSKTPGVATIQHAMNTTWLSTIRGSDAPDIISADKVYFTYYWESLQANQRFTDDKGAGAGFTNIVYHANVPVVYDDQCPASHMYFANTDYLFIRPAKGREFVPLGDRSAVNQDAIVMPMVWAGNMTVSNRARQGVIIA